MKNQVIGGGRMLSLDCLKLQMEGKYLMGTLNALSCGAVDSLDALFSKAFLTLICKGKKVVFQSGVKKWDKQKNM